MPRKPKSGSQPWWDELITNQAYLLADHQGDQVDLATLVRYVQQCFYKEPRRDTVEKHVLRMCAQGKLSAALFVGFPENNGETARKVQFAKLAGNMWASIQMQLWPEK